MKFLDLKNSNFIEIIQYLELSDLAALSATCKFFMIFFKKNEDFIQKQALPLLGIEYSPSILSWKSILLELYNSSNVQPGNFFKPYYTNGGSYRDMGYYFIWRLTQDGGTYCTHLPENVLVKYIFSPNISIKDNEEPAKYKLSEDVFNLPYIEESANDQKNLCAEISKIFIKLPLGGFTCPCEVLMCFTPLVWTKMIY